MAEKQQTKLEKLRAMREAEVERNKRLIDKTVKPRGKVVKIKRGRR